LGYEPACPEAGRAVPRATARIESVVAILPAVLGPRILHRPLDGDASLRRRLDPVPGDTALVPLTD
jgi:hypothetical protein